MKFITLLLFLPLVCLGQTTIDQAKTLFEAKKYEDAKKILKPIKSSDKQYADAQYYLGRIAFIEKDLDDAEDYLEEAIDANDKVAEYHYWMGNIAGTAIRDANVLKQAALAGNIRDSYEKAVALKPDMVDAHWGLLNYYIEAPSVMGGSFEKASNEAKIIGKYNVADGHRALGQVYNKQEKYADAEKEYLLALKENPQYVTPITNFYVARKEYDKAFKLLENILKSEPENYAVVYSVGRTSAVSGQQLDRGLECLNKYLAYTPKANEPSHHGAQMRIGQIMEKKGNKAEAKKRYEIALKGDPNLKEASEGLARVSK